LEAIEGAKEEAVAGGEVFISLQRLEVNGTYSEGTTDISASRGLDEDAAGGGIELGTGETYE